jgi:hypothetical protein
VGRPVDDDQALVGHVADQDADDAHGKVEWAETSAMDRMSWQRAAMARCSTVSLGVLLPDRGGGDQRLDLQVVVGGSDASAGHRVRPDPWVVDPWLLVGTGHGDAWPGECVQQCRVCCGLPAGAVCSTAMADA